MDDYTTFMDQFYAYSGINLAMYKRPQMERRLTFLRNKHGYRDFQGFIKALYEDTKLLHKLMDRMTINVSAFFRNPERWNALVSYLQSMTQAKLNAWSAACSTGEEPYTLAMLIEQRIGCDYQILATDIDPKVLRHAKSGAYTCSQTKAIPDSYLQRFFIRDENLCQINSQIRGHVEFKQHDLLTDPYPGSLDLIICRNVLIYFTDRAKEHVIEAFSRSLKPGGLLFLGSTEQLLNADNHSLRGVAPFLYEKYRK